MKLATLIRLYSGLMLGLTFSGITLTLWSADRAVRMTHRIDLAHQSYATHLQLSAQARQLTKQFGDALLIGDRDGGAGETALIAAIREDVTAISHIIAAEISLVGDSEVEELESLAQIDTARRRMIAEMKRLATTGIRSGPWEDDG